MPMLDVSDAILDPIFCQQLNITRREQITDNNGNVTVTTTTLTPIGVVTIDAPSPLVQVPDYALAKNAIVVHCTIQLYDSVLTSGTPYQPDLVNYNGNQYIVTKAYNWSQYGRGFTMSECELYNLQNA